LYRNKHLDRFFEKSIGNWIKAVWRRYKCRYFIRIRSYIRAQTS